MSECKRVIVDMTRELIYVVFICAIIIATSTAFSAWAFNG